MNLKAPFLLLLAAPSALALAQAPQLVRVYAVSPRILAVELQAGRVVKPGLSAYVPQAGDSTRLDGPTPVLIRGGEELGWLIGKDRNVLRSYERLVGSPLNTSLAEASSFWSMRSSNDPFYQTARLPLAVHRKSRANDWALPSQGMAVQHTLFLEFPQPLVPSRSYSLTLPVGLSDPATTSFVFDPAQLPSDAVHVSQAGFRPDDPEKRAFVSTWMGSGGALTLTAPPTFRVVRDSDKQTVLTGVSRLVLAADGTETLNRTENFAKTAVYQMNFDALAAPGVYRVVVDGIGSSLPFPVDAQAWIRAYQVQTRGLFHNRSGMAMEAPFSDYTRPRDFHPADGTRVTQSTYSILDGGQEGPGLEAGDTGIPVPEAWGGYRDAGDWNPRRATHLRVTQLQLEGYDLNPSFYRSLPISLPGDQSIPAILREAEWHLALFRRLQKPDGGVPYGLETNGDPFPGEVSWLQSMPVYVYAPDLWSSYIYAATAVRYVRLIQAHSQSLAKTYYRSALSAMNWAEADWARRKATGSLSQLPWEVAQDRNLAAIEFYRLTFDQRWHRMFEEDSVLKDEWPKLVDWGKANQREAAFVYTRLPISARRHLFYQRAVAALEGLAKDALRFQAGNAFGITQSNPWRPMFMGYFSTASAEDLVRAHFLTRKREYLAGIVAACAFPTGANPNNLSYTTGLGSRFPQNPLYIDTRAQGLPAPAGLTVYGNYDIIGWNFDWANWPIPWYLDPVSKPSVWEWPLSENYHDVFLWPMTNEFTTDTWGVNLLTWGYLAWRRS